MDATWFVENPSKDMIQRVAKERRDHISATLENRAAGKTGVPLEVAIGEPANDSSKEPGKEHPPLVLNHKPASHVESIDSPRRTESGTSQPQSSELPLVIEFANGRVLTGKGDKR